MCEHTLIRRVDLVRRQQRNFAVFDSNSHQRNQLQITCNEVIKNFQKEELFTGKRYLRTENQKAGPGLVGMVRYPDIAKEKGLKQKLKCFQKMC